MSRKLHLCLFILSSLYSVSAHASKVILHTDVMYAEAVKIYQHPFCEFLTLKVWCYYSRTNAF